MTPHRFTSYRPRLELLEDRLTMSGPGANNPGVLPPNSHPYGATYGEWSARWWQWAFSLPMDHHPLLDTADCSAGQTGKVWFLGGSFAQATVVRTCTIPTGTALFFPVVNTEASFLEGNGTTEQELRAVAAATMDTATNLSAQIDGRTIQALPDYRVQSPLFTIGPLPDNNLFGVAAGTTSQSVSDGVYLMLAPLSVGAHTIHFQGTIAGFSLDVTYNLTVAPGHTLSAASGATAFGSEDGAALAATLSAVGSRDTGSVAVVISTGARANMPAHPTDLLVAPLTPTALPDGLPGRVARPQPDSVASLDQFFAGPWEEPLQLAMK